MLREQVHKKYFLVMYILFVILGITPIYAQDDFAAVTSPPVINACACAMYQTSIMVTNTGQATTHYLVSTEGQHATLMTYANPQFILNPRESKEVFSFIKVPCDITKSYSITTKLQTGFKTVKQIPQTIQPISCDTFSITGLNTEQWSNACTPTVYALEVSNQMNYLQVVELSMDIAQQYYRLTHNPVVLAPYETKQVYLYLTLPCEFSENYEFTLMAKEKAAGKTLALPLTLHINQNSYVYSVELGNEVPISNPDEPTITYSYARKDVTNYNLCANTDNIIPVKLANVGYMYNGYKVQIQDDKNNQQQWISYDPSYFWLYPYYQVINPLYLSPTTKDQGNYTLNLISTSYKGDYSYQIPFLVSVEQCTEQQLSRLSEDSKKKWLIGLGLLLLALLFAIIAVLVIFIINRKKKVAGFHPIAEDYYAKQKEKEEQERLATLKAEEAARAKKTAKKTKQSFPEPLSFWKVLLLILLVFLVGCLVTYGAIYAATHAEVTKSKFQNLFAGNNLSNITKTNLTSNLTKQNTQKITSPTKPTVLSATKLNATTTAPKKQDLKLAKPSAPTYDPKKGLNDSQIKVLYREMYEDKPYSFLLDGYFIDADNDTLVITHSPVKNLSIFLDGTYVKVTPDPDFTGERRVTFIADDSKGGIAYSPEFRFNIKSVPEFTTKISKNIVGILAVLFVIFVLITIGILFFLKPPRKAVVQKKKSMIIEFE